MPTSNSMTPELYRAIHATDIETLQDMVVSMCENSAQCAAEASSKLLVSEDEVFNGGTGAEIKPGNNGREDEQHSENAPQGKKRKLDAPPSFTPRHETCEICEQRYDVTKNSADACQTHAGELEQVESYWETIDIWEDDEVPPENPEPDDEEWVQQHPEGWRWNCCELLFGAPACVVGQHVPRGY